MVSDGGVCVCCLESEKLTGWTRGIGMENFTNPIPIVRTGRGL